ncbi:hypothetical protein [Clostridium manihotivorum]|uniref:Uncharacterized protein n=1 Tax=Clostridium manihotivorum TaxID=2320868 RepID=A0A410DR18_9CLOT|nr:hypothetical protein [Clostridium manihotivorum]QAA31482.1 hypothetical protein C1I91_07445 [Clostridium manihotivorum]
MKKLSILIFIFISYLLLFTPLKKCNATNTNNPSISFEEICKNSCLVNINKIRLNYSLSPFHFSSDLDTTAAHYLNKLTIEKDAFTWNDNDNDTVFCIYRERLTPPLQYNNKLVASILLDAYKQELLSTNISNIGLCVRWDNRTLTYAFVFKYN